MPLENEAILTAITIVSGKPDAVRIKMSNFLAFTHQKVILTTMHVQAYSKFTLHAKYSEIRIFLAAKSL